MKTKINLTLCVIVLVSLLTFSCKETVTKDNPIEEKTQSQANIDNENTMPVLDPALDPLVVGKEFSKVFSDTLNVQMYEFTMKPGDSVGLHQHLDHSVYVLQGGKLKLYINGTNPVDMELKSGVGFVGGPLTDAAKNIGETTIKLILTEIHRPREN
jgi:quercetin dioxygenase-like cupin family protein